MKTKREIVQSINDVIQKCDDRADDYLRAAKARGCYDKDAVRAGLVKGAAVLAMVGAWLRDVTAEPEAPQGIEETQEDIQ